MSEKIKPHHVERKAILYVRQSSAYQVQNNLESQKLQYAMQDRLRHLGWQGIEIVDEDLGRTASGTVTRAGFERMVAEVCLGHVGAVAAREVSRFARNSREWQKLVEVCRIVDPRRTSSARAAEYHLQLRPGTDCALALAMLHVVIGELLYDRDFVERYCTGFEELAAHVVPYSPEWAEPITQVPANNLRSAARAFATTHPACVLWGNGIDMSVNAFQTARAYLLLMAITGNLDVPGGMVQWVPPQDIRSKSPMIDHNVGGQQFITPQQKAKMIGAGRFPFAPDCHLPTFWQACISGTPYRPRAVWLVGTNPLVTETRGDLIETALRDHLEFTVVSDFFFTPTAELADLVLPAAHWLEQDDVAYFLKIWCVLARRKVAQIGEARDDRASNPPVAVNPRQVAGLRASGASGAS